VEEYAGRWTKARGLHDPASHLRIHLLPIIGHVSMGAVQPRQGDQIVAALGSKIVADEMSHKTAENIWASAKMLFKDAAHAKPATGLRCLETSPFRDVSPPERDKVKKVKQWVYADEFLAFVSCPHSRCTGGGTSRSRSSPAYGTTSNARSAGRTWTSCTV
jgi:hypothetical protein